MNREAGDQIKQTVFDAVAVIDEKYPVATLLVTQVTLTIDTPDGIEVFTSTQVHEDYSD